jgi:hypothetical protein
VILDPINDVECLEQLTTIARELSSTTLVRTVALHLGTRERVIQWFQSKPQADDDGTEAIRYITCDVPQRVRLLADDPNCVERATDALMLLEALEQMKKIAAVPRALATVERPARHTGLVERRGEHWYAVDLFPRRNARRNIDWSDVGKDVLQGAHTYVGKPILQFYGLGSAADTIGENENKLIGRDKTNEKKQKPPTGESSGPKPKAGSQPVGKSDTGAQLRPVVGVLGAGAKSSTGQTPGKGGEHAETESRKALLQALAAGPDERAGAAPQKAGEKAERGRSWWGLG